VALRPDQRDELIDLVSSPTWMYEWDLGDGLRTAVMHPELPSVHDTRAAIIEPFVREALAGGESTALDLACSEGWFAQRLLDWGAARVLGVDIRPENIHRAELVRDHLGLDPERLAFQVADVFDLPVLPRFDVVLCLGLVYHLENPIGALRIARALTRGLCLVESQLVEPHSPLRHGWGATDEYLEEEAAWAAMYEPEELQRTHPMASHGGVVSFIPNRAALEQALSAAGFSRVEVPPVPADSNPQYLGGHRLVLAGRP
jgi:tRNA (mo5U34)-methyltransferase